MVTLLFAKTIWTLQTSISRQSCISSNFSCFIVFIVTCSLTSWVNECHFTKKHCRAILDTCLPYWDTDYIFDNYEQQPQPPIKSDTGHNFQFLWFFKNLKQATIGTLHRYLLYILTLRNCFFIHILGLVSSWNINFFFRP